VVGLLVGLLLLWFLGTRSNDPAPPPEPDPEPAPGVVTTTAPPAMDVPADPEVEGDCALLVRLNAAGCEDGVELTLSTLDGAWEDGVFLSCEGAAPAKSWSGMPCEWTMRATARAEGFAEVQRVTRLEPPLTTIELSMNRARVLRIQAVDTRDGTPIADAWGAWYGNAANAFRVDATTWKGRQGIIEIAVPLAYPMLVGASGFAPRTWNDVTGAGPDDYQVLELEPVEEFTVRCTLDGERCAADDEDLRVISVWHRYLGPFQQADCEPLSDDGDFLCRGVRTGLEAQAYIDQLVSEPKSWTLPAVYGWDGQDTLGETVIEFPLDDPIPLELFSRPQKDLGDPFCVTLVRAQPGHCSLRIPSLEVGVGATDWGYTPGETREWPLDLEDEGILECEDGWAVITRGMAACGAVELEPWGAVCVDAGRFNSCALLGSLPPLHYHFESCYGQVRPGRWAAHCRDESTGSLRFIDCGQVEVAAGETTEITCPQ